MLKNIIRLILLRGCKIMGQKTKGAGGALGRVSSFNQHFIDRAWDRVYREFRKIPGNKVFKLKHILCKYKNFKNEVTHFKT